jgi:hypothetical protein
MADPEASPLCASSLEAHRPPSGGTKRRRNFPMADPEASPLCASSSEVVKTSMPVVMKLC